MDWLLELLKKAGVEDTKAGEIVGDVNKELPKHFVSKSQYNDVSEAKRKAETDLADRDKQLEALSKDKGASEELKQQIAQLQADNQAAKEKYETEAKDLQLNTALKLKLAGKVHENALANVIAEFDKSKIVLDEQGNIKEGFDDQEKSLRESKGFYFVPEKKEEGFNFTGFKPFEGKGSDKGSNPNDNFGKQLAEANKQSNEAMQKAQADYFK